MSDFFQGGIITTLHRLGMPSLTRLEAELTWHSHKRPIALVLPALYSEFEGQALKRIVDALNCKNTEYIREIVVALGPASEEQYRHAKSYMGVLPHKSTVVWITGPRISGIFKDIKEADVPIGEPGKGQSVWMAYGYVLSKQEFHSIALHDCDIITYDREMLARLCYPVTNSHLDYEFCKGYYTRVTDRLHGRVTRLLVTPLLRALKKLCGEHLLFTYFDSFRYPLAGEFSMDTRLVRVNRIPGDWGLEVGVLAEVKRNTTVRRICQVDIADNYEHKHQPLSPDDATKGLHKMCVDICKSLFRTMMSEGIQFSPSFSKMLLVVYVRTAQDMLEMYEDDAAINGLVFDRHGESRAIETFKTGIQEAVDIITTDPLGVPLIASWDRVTSAVPNILERLQKAVIEDNEM